jgi:hypothetical protein
MEKIGEIYHVEMPENLKISNNQYGYCLLSQNKVKKGELVYQFKTIWVPNDGKTISFKLTTDD